jgi:bifunctional non-homologous end joining protein LigD
MIDDKRIRISDHVEAGRLNSWPPCANSTWRTLSESGRTARTSQENEAVRGFKYRVNRGQELVIGGYTPGPHGIGAIIVGYQGDGGLTYVARIRNRFVRASRRQVFERLRPLA